MNRTRPKPLKALIIIEDVERRARLKLAIHHDQYCGLPTFGKVHAVNTLNDGFNKLTSDPGYDLILVSDSFRKDKIEEFLEDVQALREEKFGFIIVLTSNEQEKVAVADNLISGADAFLCEPYSVDMLREITEIAERVRRENQEKRIICGAELVVDVASKEIDHRAKRLLLGKPDRPFSKKIKRAFRMFKGLSEDAQSDFYKTIMNATEKSSPGQKPSGYDGASERVRMKLEEEEKPRKKPK